MSMVHRELDRLNLKVSRLTEIVGSLQDQLVGQSEFLGNEAKDLRKEIRLTIEEELAEVLNQMDKILATGVSKPTITKFDTGGRPESKNGPAQLDYSDYPSNLDQSVLIAVPKKHQRTVIKIVDLLIKSDPDEPDVSNEESDHSMDAILAAREHEMHHANKIEALEKMQGKGHDSDESKM